MGFAWRQVRPRSGEEEVDVNAEEAAALAVALTAGLAALEGAWPRWEALRVSLGPVLAAGERQLATGRFAVARGAWSREAGLLAQS